MKLGIIGQGAASLFLSLALIKDNNIDITIIDRNEKLFKKLYATGNGRCNLGNFIVECQTFNNEFAFDLSKKYDANSLISFLNKFGVLTRTIDESLIYPYSLSAKSLIDYLISYLKKRNVNFISNTEVVEYKLEKNNKIKVISKDNNEFVFDKLIIDTGGKSSLNLGTDGSFFEILKKHGYEISSLYPGLTPIKVKENIKELENERIKVVATLINNDKELIVEIRNIRTKMNVHPSKKSKLLIISNPIEKEIKESEEFLSKLGFANEILIIKDEAEVPQNAVSIVIDDLKVFIPFEELVDISEEIKRLEGEKKKLESEVQRGEKMLSNPGFVNKAPEAKVNEEKEKLENYKKMLENVKERLESLK